MSTNCPICDANLEIQDNIEASEVISCSDCNNQLVVAEKKEDRVILEEAPEVEEDWGE